MALKYLSIIIVSYNTREILKECLRRVAAYSQGIDLETIVVDNASTDDSPDMIRSEFSDVVLIESKKNLGFAGGNNLGIRMATGRYVLLLNSDAYLLPGTLQSTVSFMENTSDCGVLGVKLIGEDGGMQPCARSLPDPWLKFLVISGIAARFPESKWFGGPDHSWWSHDSPKDVGWVPGAYFLIRREVVDTIGVLDERYFLYFEETDYCLQAVRAGWRVMILPDVSVIHLGGESSKTTRQRMSTKGKQLIQYRLQSEFMYYRKNFGVFYLLMSAGVELAWTAIVIAKNGIFGGKGASEKIKNGKMLMAEIFWTLKNHRLGQGRRAAPD